MKITRNVIPLLGVQKSVMKMPMNARVQMRTRYEWLHMKRVSGGYCKYKQTLNDCGEMRLKKKGEVLRRNQKGRAV
ncbi:hypothetical protein BDZ94DRAFT_671766 [Collybia nuda]|uniref:Uncharacterized protein n=1 Tax=Collybia nuda TaxID=64659 RepID=A0A9P5YH42_9AGAR|nr:hypothetical protein BDZ94DRAFT_671766 [Collybia nuda]